MMRRQPGDQPGARWTCRTPTAQDRDELALLRQVGHRERDVADDGEAAEPFGHVRELDDVAGRGRPDGWAGHDQSSTTRYGNRPR
jgi:hypothetical protein